MNGIDDQLFREQVFAEKGKDTVVKLIATEIIGELTDADRANLLPSTLEKPIWKKLEELGINYSRGAIHQAVCEELGRRTGIDVMGMGINIAVYRGGK